MEKSCSKLVLLALFLGLEIVRELVTLRRLGFEPERFIEWLRGGQVV